MREKQKSSAASALEKLRRQRQTGRTALDTYVPDDDKIYDELDETDYQLLARKRLNEEFVVDDDGLGYADYGVDDWDEPREGYSSEADDGDQVKKAKTTKAEKQKKDKNAANRKHGQDIAEMFRKKIQQDQLGKKKGLQVVGPQTSKVSGVSSSANNDDDDLSQMLNEIDNETVKIATNKDKGQRMKRVGSHHQSFAGSKRIKPTISSKVSFQKKKSTVSPTEDVTDNYVVDYDHDQDMDYSAPGDYTNVYVPTSATNAPIESVPEEPEEDLSIKVKTKSLKVSSAKDNAKKAVKMPTSQVKPVVKYSGEVVVKEGKGNDWWNEQKTNVVAGESSSQNADSGVDASSQGVDSNITKDLFYWYDGHEEGRNVFLFGKKLGRDRKEFVSCCVNVKNMQRSVYFLPREFVYDFSTQKETKEEVSVEELWKELDEIMTKNKIRNWTMSQVVKKYAFEDPDVPHEADWVEVNYSFSDPMLDIKEGRTFCKVFGANTGGLESLIMSKNLMGPSWLELLKPKKSEVQKSWCKEEYEVDYENIYILTDTDINDSGKYPEFCKTAPTMTVLSISIKTIMNYKTNDNEIMICSGMVFKGVEASLSKHSKNKKPQISCFSCVRQEADSSVFPLGFNDLIKKKNVNSAETTIKRETARNERALISFLLASIQKYDPDILVGHNLIGYDLDVLLNRVKHLMMTNDPGWSKLGRLRRNNFITSIPTVCSGRLLADSYVASRDNIKSKNYSLTNLVKQCLNTDRVDLDRNSFQAYYKDAESLFYLIQHCENDAFLSMQIINYIQYIPLTMQLTQLAGFLWGKTMRGSRAERNEYLLLHEFSKLGYLVPDNNKGIFANHGNNAPKKKEDLKKKSKKSATEKKQEKENANVDDNPYGNVEDVEDKSKEDESYVGGLVLDPKIGLYDKFVLLLDFNSLYPSIIQEYNLCFTTIDRNNNELPDPGLQQGVLPHILQTLVQRRRTVKQMMKSCDNDAERDQLNIRQLGLKLTANSMYGCLGFQMSRFYCKQLAAMITGKGREILQETVDLAERELQLNVIYGDTDSIMIYTNTTDMATVKQMGAKLKQSVNKKYKLLEIEMDGCFKKMLLLKKKKYAAVTIEEKANGELVEKREIKGLDLVRRDWCGLTFEMSNFVLEKILSDESKDEFHNELSSYLTDMSSKLKNGEIDLEKFIIRKTLSKNASSYNETKALPHVKVALKMMEKGECGGKIGDMIPYVMCKELKSDDAEENRKSETVPHHPNDLLYQNEGGKIVIDYDWYLNVQIFPPISRLLCVIEGIDNQTIADCLGIEKKYFSTTSDRDSFEEYFTLNSQLNDQERFKYCQRFLLPCKFCSTTLEIETPAVKHDKSYKPCFYCTSCNSLQPSGYVAITLVKQAREHIKLYYMNYMVCDDPSCQHRTRQVSVESELCSKCGGGTNKLEYSDSDLYNQLLFYSYAFDVDRQIERTTDRDTKGKNNSNEF